MSYVVDPFPPFADTPLFPLDGPPPMVPDWELAEVRFMQPAWENAHGMHDFVEFTWMTEELLGSSGLISQIASGVAQYFVQQGEGTPLALRLYHREVLDVSVPTQMCLPSFLPFGAGGCHDIPVIGGQTLLSVHQWHLQFVYHNPIALEGIWAFMTILLVLGVVGAAVLAATHGSVDLGSALTQPVKDVIDASAAGARSVSQGITSTLLLGIVALGVVAWVFPQLQTSASAGGRLGPINVQTSAQGRPRAAARGGGS